MNFNEAAIKSKITNNQILKIWHATVNAGQRAYAEHHHTEFEISLFNSGKGIYKVGNKEYDFQKNDIFMFASNENHCIINLTTEEPLDLINIHFEPRFIWSAENEIDIKFLRIFLERDEKIQNRVQRDSEASLKMQSIIRNIEKEFDDKKAEFAFMIKSEIMRLLVIAVRTFEIDFANTINIKRHNLVSIEKSIDYILKNLSENIELSALAKKSNMSKTYFSSVFKRLNGISPWDYITIKRIEKSALMLKNNEDMTILGIAMSCGFNNTANFNRAFKKITGKTPTEFKNGI